jgi:hypothetical protein
MSDSIGNRIKRLENAIPATLASCPKCGAGWEGSIVLSIDADGAEQAVCIVCQTPRPVEGWRVMKAYPRELIEAL